jgi:PHD/YefM family antitoxin component YafN of YafNO toxin-antitoxin module
MQWINPVSLRNAHKGSGEVTQERRKEQRELYPGWFGYLENKHYFCTKKGTYLTIKIMGVLEITSRQFRDKQKDVFELADKGERVAIKRGRKQAYVLIPVDDDDLYFTPEMLEKIDRSIQQAKEGKVTKIRSIEELDKFLGV